MNTPVKNIAFPGKIFTATDAGFNSLALEIFRFQFEFNPVYRKYCTTLGIDIHQVDSQEKIPFLPIQFFKSHQVMTTEFTAEVIFESSGTTLTVPGKHFVKDTSIYRQSFDTAFRLFYGDPASWCIIALLPSYLEKGNASLVMMADALIRESCHAASGFYLDDFRQLQRILQQLEQQQQKTLLLGVTYALLDFAEQYPLPLQYTTIMETGGMKGRRQEMTRQQVHELLCSSFHLTTIHSEYGMTELLSQAYSAGNGIFQCPPWMKILLREEDDPFAIHGSGNARVKSGAVNIIDLANVYSCSFIATDDAGKLYPDGTFEILGRLDHTDIRGCSLLSL